MRVMGRDPYAPKNKIGYLIMQDVKKIQHKLNSTFFADHLIQCSYITLTRQFTSVQVQTLSASVEVETHFVIVFVKRIELAA